MNETLIHRIDGIFRGLMAEISRERESSHKARMERAAMIKFKPAKPPQKPMPAKKPRKGKRK